MNTPTFDQLRRNLKKPAAPGATAVRVALLGDSATQLLATALRGAGRERGFDLQVWEAEYDQIELQAFDPGSDLYRFRPEVVVVFISTQKLLSKYNAGAGGRGNAAFGADALEAIRRTADAIAEQSQAQVIFYNFSEIDDAVFGNFANKVEGSFLFQLRKLNVELMALAASHPSIHVCDLSSIQNRLGRGAMFQASLYVASGMVLSIDALPAVAARTMDIVAALRGRARKCLIVDLDNTLWGGVIGDDGIENIEIGKLGVGRAYTELQEWMRKLKDRGVLLAVCSKNDPAVAQEPFRSHPEMVLRLDDIAAFVANWDNKVDNIRLIQETLGIGMDSIVFLDDNPFEREMVRGAIPELTVPDLPADPAEYLDHLCSLGLFETASLSSEDLERTRLYQAQARRAADREKYANEGEFLQGLEMVSKVEGFSAFNTPRVAQLSQRSNQFNLRTVRYTEADIARLGASPDHVPLAFTLEDRLGDHGLICVVILEKRPGGAFIDTWFMSCRVLKRTMENFVLNAVVEAARAAGCAKLLGEYRATPKNGMVRDHYRDLGFAPAGPLWELDVAGYRPRPTHISRKAA